MTLTRNVPGAFDPVAGSATGSTSVQYTVFGITANYSRFTMASTYNDPNSMILSGDKKAIIGADVIEPLPGDVITVMGVDWVVISIDTLCPQGVNLMFTVQIRK